MSTMLLKVDGMSCGHCVNRIDQALKGVPGVESVQVVLDAGQASVTGENLDPAALVKAVEEAGYKAAVAE